MPGTFYIEDIVYGANDGIVTTFAIVAGERARHSLLSMRSSESGKKRRGQ